MNNAFSLTGLKLNGTHELLVYAILIYGSKTSILTKKNTETLLVQSKEIGLEVNAENIGYTPVS
jgi:hypothetical protein